MGTRLISPDEQLTCCSKSSPITLEGKRCFVVIYDATIVMAMLD